MEANHTPGPWEIATCSNFFGFSVRSAEGPDIAECRHLIERSAEQNDEMMANACLIAAAPELLEALKDVEWCNGGFCAQCARGPRQGHQPRCIVGNAIAKAEGREQPA